jgi:hypothetical protein
MATGGARNESGFHYCSGLPIPVRGRERPRRSGATFPAKLRELPGVAAASARRQGRKPLSTTYRTEKRTGCRTLVAGSGDRTFTVTWYPRIWSVIDRIGDVTP